MHKLVTLIIFAIASPAVSQQLITLSDVTHTVPQGKVWTLPRSKEFLIEITDDAFRNVDNRHYRFYSMNEVCCIQNISEGLLNVDLDKIFRFYAAGISKVPYLNQSTFLVNDVQKIVTSKEMTRMMNEKITEKELAGINDLRFTQGQRILLTKDLKSIQVLESDLTENEIKEIKEGEIITKSQLKRESETRARTYDIQTYDKTLFASIVSQQKENLLNYFKYSTTFFAPTGNSYFLEFTQRYSAHYKLTNLTTFSTDQVNSFSHISGDLSKQFYSACAPKISTIVLDGVQVLTEVEISDINIWFITGETKVKVSNGQIEYKKNPPPLKAQKELESKMRSLPNGTTPVRFKVITVLDKTEVKIMTPESQYGFNDYKWSNKSW